MSWVLYVGRGRGEWDILDSMATQLRSPNMLITKPMYVVLWSANEFPPQFIVDTFTLIGGRQCCGFCPISPNTPKLYDILFGKFTLGAEHLSEKIPLGPCELIVVTGQLDCWGKPTPLELPLYTSPGQFRHRQKHQEVRKIGWGKVCICSMPTRVSINDLLPHFANDFSFQLELLGLCTEHNDAPQIWLCSKLRSNDMIYFSISNMTYVYISKETKTLLMIPLLHIFFAINL